MNIDYNLVVVEEKKWRYDVMVYVYMFGVCCFKVVFIIYFGVILCYVGDNIVSSFVVDVNLSIFFLCYIFFY